MTFEARRKTKGRPQPTAQRYESIAVERSPESDQPHRVGVAISGGGSHGAFAAGLIHTTFTRYWKERRLPRLTVITGTSTGALVGVLLSMLYGEARARPFNAKRVEAVLATLEDVYKNSGIL